MSLPPLRAGKSRVGRDEARIGSLDEQFEKTTKVLCKLVYAKLAVTSIILIAGNCRAVLTIIEIWSRFFYDTENAPMSLSHPPWHCPTKGCPNSSIFPCAVLYKEAPKHCAFFISLKAMIAHLRRYFSSFNHLSSSFSTTKRSPSNPNCSNPSYLTFVSGCPQVHYPLFPAPSQPIVWRPPKQVVRHLMCHPSLYRLLPQARGRPHHAVLRRRVWRPLEVGQPGSVCRRQNHHLGQKRQCCTVNFGRGTPAILPDP